MKSGLLHFNTNNITERTKCNIGKENNKISTYGFNAVADKVGVNSRGFGYLRKHSLES